MKIVHAWLVHSIFLIYVAAIKQYNLQVLIRFCTTKILKISYIVKLVLFTDKNHYLKSCDVFIGVKIIHEQFLVARVAVKWLCSKRLGLVA